MFILQLNRYEDTSTSLALMRLIRKKFSKATQLEVNMMEHRSSKTWTLPELLDGLNEVIEGYEKLDDYLPAKSASEFNIAPVSTPRSRSPTPEPHYDPRTCCFCYSPNHRSTRCYHYMPVASRRVIANRVVSPFDSVGNASVMDIPVLPAIVLNVPLATVTITICFVPVHADEVVDHPRQGDITIPIVHVPLREARHVATEEAPLTIRAIRGRRPVPVPIHPDDLMTQVHLRVIEDLIGGNVHNIIRFALDLHLMTVEALAVDHQTKTSTTVILLLDTGAQRSFISHDAVTRLNTKVSHITPLTTVAFGAVRTAEPSGMVNVDLVDNQARKIRLILRTKEHLTVPFRLSTSQQKIANSFNRTTSAWNPLPSAEPLLQTS
uniref:Peptidase A2 domain-containing protein n=1 Tax=Haemonchus contortus TaxID=6289 RepID=W6NGV6_HAECO